MTERLYLADPYLTSFNARIIERRHLPPDARLAVILDRTAFSPAVAGLLADRGTLGEAQVLDVYEDDQGYLLHVISQEVWRDEVQGRLDWPRRFDMMQHHTAQHILSEALFQVAGAETAAVYISPQAAWLEVTKSIPEADLERALVWANQLIATGRAVRTASVDPTRVGAAPGQAVRVFNIEGLRVQVCPAVHVARTSELGVLRIARVDRVNGRMRIEFQCGARVFGDLQRRDQLVTRLAAMVGAPVAELEQAITNLMTQATQATEAVTALRSKMIEYECMALEATSERIGDVRVVNRVFAERDPAEVRQLARMLSERAGLVILLATAGARAQLFFARSADVSHDMNVLIKAAAQAIGTQGGGQPQWAESMLVRADASRVEAALNKAAKLLQAKR